MTMCKLEQSRHTKVIQDYVNTVRLVLGYQLTFDSTEFIKSCEMLRKGLGDHVFFDLYTKMWSADIEKQILGDEHG